MTHRSRTRVLLVAAATALLLPLTACSDEEDPSGGGASEAPASSSPSETADAPSEEPADSESSVEPATGPALSMPPGTVHAPQGWKKTPAIGDLQVSAASANYRDSVRFSALELPSGGFGTSLEEQMRAALKSTSEKPKPQPMDPVEIDGVEWYHLSNGPDGGAEIYGVDHNGYQTTLAFSFLDDDTTPDEREAIVASVLASFTWA